MFDFLKSKPRVPPHEHKWKLVACNDEYYTTYTDTKQKVNWHQRFYECECGARKHTDNRPNYLEHKGIEEAKQNWIDIGMVPGKSYVPGEATGYYKISSKEREEIDPVLQYERTLADIAKTLEVVIKRDFKMEERYPDLAEAADNYHRILEQYRVMDILKGEKETEQ